MSGEKNTSTPVAAAPGMIVPILGTRTQWGYVVRDIEMAMQHWIDMYRVGPFIYITDVGAGCTFQFNGEPTAPVIDAAYTYLGETQIELISQRNSAPSPYSRFLASGREGLQHIGFWTTEYEATRKHLEGRGLRPEFMLWLPGATQPTVYYEERSSMGTMIEVCELTPQKSGLYAAMANLTRNWDGTRPVRRYERMSDFAREVGASSWS